MGRVWLLLVSMAACGGVEPAPQIAQLSPQLVCGSGTLPLAVRGQNFLALPVRTLSGSTSLEVPSARLIPQSGSVVFPEVLWFSTELLSLRVPLEQLGQGSYALELSDPDGQHALRDEALTYLDAPPVMISSLAPQALCIQDGDWQVTIAGTGFVAGAEVSIRDGSGAEVLRPAAVVTADSVVLTLPAHSLIPGDYTLVVENPEQAGCSASAATPLVIDPPPEIKRVLPTNICGSGGRVVVTGSGLYGGATVELVDGNRRSSASSVSVVASDRAVVTLPANNFPKNDYADLVWHNPDGCSDVSANALRIKPGNCN